MLRGETPGEPWAVFGTAETGSTRVANVVAHWDGPGPGVDVFDALGPEGQPGDPHDNNGRYDLVYDDVVIDPGETAVFMKIGRVSRDLNGLIAFAQDHADERPRFFAGMRSRALTLAVAATEAGTLRASGTIDVPGASRVVRFRPVTRRVRTGQVVRLGLRLSARDLATVRRARRAGRRLSARMSVTATDAAGNRRVQGVRVQLRR